MKTLMQVSGTPNYFTHRCHRATGNCLKVSYRLFTIARNVADHVYKVDHER
jgi:hypothetical protein